MEFPQKVWKNIVLLHIAGFDFERFDGGPGVQTQQAPESSPYGDHKISQADTYIIYQIVTHKDSQAWPI